MKQEGSVAQGTLGMVHVLSVALKARDRHTYSHCQRVSHYAVSIMERMGTAGEHMAMLQATALLHDIGKLAIGSGILNKAGPLTERDWQLVQAHPRIGVSILKHVDSLAPCLPGIKHHHERYDGAGYPSGLRGNDIPLDARIVAIADAYEAMTSPRPYRVRTLTNEEALAELERHMSTQFDPDLVLVFVDIMKQRQS